MSEERIVLGAGCFWGVQHILRKIDGILKTEVGYHGGEESLANYENVCKGTSGHAEVVDVLFDNEIIKLEKVLSYFWRLHDPTSLNRQGNDIGHQYRSVIFYFSDEQKKIVESSIAKLNMSKVFKKNAVTEILPYIKFYKAEAYHQDYYQRKFKTSGVESPICHYLRDFDV